MRWTVDLSEVTMADVPAVGGKNASLGELMGALAAAGVRVPAGFAVTTDAFRHFVAKSGLEPELRRELAVAREGVSQLAAAASRIRNRIMVAPLPEDLRRELAERYDRAAVQWGVAEPHVAVRSSATAEGLPGASFAGQQESYLEVHGHGELIDAVRRCFASLFTARAIGYREERGVDHFAVALSVGVQRMVRASRGSAGVAFTVDTHTGFDGVVLIASSYGLGENVVQGHIEPDELYVHKQTLRDGFEPLVWKKCGEKQLRLVYDDASQRLKNLAVPERERRRMSLSDDDALTLARWALAIEDHYGVPMDIEWAVDGDSGELFVVQARPVTAHGQRPSAVARVYELRERGDVIAQGVAVGDAIAGGAVRVIHDPVQLARFRAGEVLATHATDPDWEPIMKRAAGVVTERGGRTSHAAIVAREIGIPAVVGARDVVDLVADGDEVTVSCAEGERGYVYRGRLPFDVHELDARALPPTRTRIMMNVAQPEQAFRLAQIPNDGVGLARMEYVFASWVGVHPLALTRPGHLPPMLRARVDAAIEGHADGPAFFVDRLSQGIGTLAAAFWPKPVIVRFSDFKTNEYARLVGGELFEPDEANPMIGWRGASRYYHPDFKEGFLLEVAAIRRVREQFGLTNLNVMVPFCRTPEEGARVLEVVAEHGLVRGERGLEVYVMAEVPSNVLLADRFAELFDGFSIGSNDLTQLVLGVDRGSERIAWLFDERNEAVLRACTMLIDTAHRAGRTVGVCGQAPSDFPDFASFLVERGIDSMSLSPDAVVPTRLRVAAIERARAGQTAGATPAHAR